MGKILTHSIVIFFLFLVVNAFFPSSAVFAAGSSLIKGGKFPGLSLPVPKDSFEKKYLGLSGEGLFKLPQIKAEGVLIQVFSTYCPMCQTTASALGELYRRIEKHPDLKKKIKMIGIGVGNNALEVEVFKQTYDIRFPVFPDETYAIHQELGETRTPFFIAVKMSKDGPPRIVYTHLGGLTNVAAFLTLVADAYGINHEDLLIRQAGSTPVEPSTVAVP